VRHPQSVAATVDAHRLALPATHCGQGTTIATAAVEFALGDKVAMKRSRKPEIMADPMF
jgi:hypothetical protein